MLPPGMTVGMGDTDVAAIMLAVADVYGMGFGILYGCYKLRRLREDVNGKGEGEAKRGIWREVILGEGKHYLAKAGADDALRTA